MNVEETAMLFREARGGFPGQKFDDYTPSMWLELFADYPYRDMRAGLMWCIANKEWLSVKDMLGEVRRLRQKRIAEAFEELYPPAEVRDSEDPGAYIRWLAQAVKGLGDGEVPELPRALVGRDPQTSGGGPRGGAPRRLVAGLRDVPDADTEEAS